MNVEHATQDNTHSQGHGDIKAIAREIARELAAELKRSNGSTISGDGSASQGRRDASGAHSPDQRYADVNARTGLSNPRVVEGLGAKVAGANRLDRSNHIGGASEPEAGRASSLIEVGAFPNIAWLMRYVFAFVAIFSLFRVIQHI